MNLGRNFHEVGAKMLSDYYNTVIQALMCTQLLIIRFEGSTQWTTNLKRKSKRPKTIWPEKNVNKLLETQ